MTICQAVAWEGTDTEDQFSVRIYGRCSDGKSLAVGIPFNPYFYVKIRRTHSFPEFKTKIQTKFKRDLVDVREIHAKDLWGFQNGLLSRFVRIEFKTLRSMRICASSLEKGNGPEGFGQLKIYESNIDPVLRFMHVSGIKSTGWFEVGDCEPDYSTSCDVSLWAPTIDLVKPVERDDIAPLKIMSFDIECYSKDGSFPTPHTAEDVIFQIGMTIRLFGSEETTRKCLCLKETDTEDCESFKTEKALLQRFEKYITEVDPDIVTGWNIFGFDLEFLLVRSTLNNLAPTWGRFKDSPVDLVTKNLSSSALGDNLLKMVPMRGRYVFDLFQDVKREHKLESYSLNNVSKHFLKEQKNDMPVKEIFSRYAEGDPKRLGEVAEYCIQDTVLPHNLMNKLCQIQNQIEMAKACWVPLAFLSERGQQIKVFSQMAYKARQLGFIIPVFRAPPGTASDEKYQGATVLEAQTGAYYTPITALDFASLYPSIMCAHNLCYSSLVMDPQFDNLPGVEYEQFGPFRFAQNTPSLLPVILTDLKAFRKKAKKLMAAAEGTPMEAVYNGQQLAYKISMNSIYGFTGASKGMLPLLAIASTVTMRGRQMIEETKNYVEANFPGANVRYGDTDSVMVEFDTQGRKGQEAIDYSWKLGEQAAEECTKLFKVPNELELEKVYCPYFLYSKKRYAAKMYEKNKKGEIAFKKIDVKGLQVVRRDSCQYVRETLKSLLEMILASDDPKPPVQFAKDAAKLLTSGDVPIDKLLMSKQLASDYKVSCPSCKSHINQSKINDPKQHDTGCKAAKEILNSLVVSMPHVAVRDKIKKRTPGSEPQQGDRVSFVIVEGPKNAKMFEKAEDPAWVSENDIKIDYQYYFTNQLKKPVCDLLEPLLGSEADKILFAPKVKKITDFFGLKN
jgi:DNA polymerase delta subunit 1